MAKTTVFQIKKWRSGQSARFSPATAMQILGVSSRTTLSSDRKTLNCHDRPLSNEDLVELAKLRVFLNARPGIHSRSQYARLRRYPFLLEAKFRQLGIPDINQRTKEMLYES